MNRINYPGLVAMVIATSLGLGIIISLVGLAWHGKSLSEYGGEALIAVGSALTGALATYMGVHKE